MLLIAVCIRTCTMNCLICVVLEGSALNRSEAHAHKHTFNRVQQYQKLWQNLETTMLQIKLTSSLLQKKKQKKLKVQFCEFNIEQQNSCKRFECHLFKECYIFLTLKSWNSKILCAQIKFTWKKFWSSSHWK